MGSCCSSTSEKTRVPQRFSKKALQSIDNLDRIKKDTSNDQVKSAHDLLASLHLLDVTQREHGSSKVARWHPADFIMGTRRGQLMFFMAAAIALWLIGAGVWVLRGGWEDGGYDSSFEQSIWFSWGMFFDPGTQMSLPADAPQDVKLIAATCSVTGFLFNLILLGLIVEMARTTLEEWEKRRSRIVATGHTLMLGWSDKTLFMLKEIMCAAADSNQKPHIVILAEEEVLMMKSLVHRHFPKSRDQRVFQFRKGCPYECEELIKVSAASAQEIFILGASGHSRTSDLTLIRTVVALASLPDLPNGAIVGEVRHSETSNVIRTIMDTASGVFARDAINRVMCLMAVEPAVGHAFEDLLSFVSGNELYCQPMEKMSMEVQKASTFGEAARCLNSAVVIGVQTGDMCDIAPRDDRPLAPGDRLMIIARDHNDFAGNMMSNFWGTTNESNAPAFVEGGKVASTVIEDHSKAQTIVIVGWSNDVGDFMQTLDFHLKGGSHIYILSEVPIEARKEKLLLDTGRSEFKNLTLHHVVGAPTNLKFLKSMPLRNASSILVMSEDFEEFGNDPCASDSANLAVVITLNSILLGMNFAADPTSPASGGRGKRPKVICEILDAGSERMLGSNTELRNSAMFFHSNALETGLFAIASTDPAVFNCLLRMMQPNHAGSIAAIPVEVFLNTEELGKKTLDWWDLWYRAREREELLIGWHRKEHEEPEINPKQESRSTIDPFSHGDQFIVLHTREHFKPGEDIGDDQYQIPLEPHAIGVSSTDGQRI